MVGDTIFAIGAIAWVLFALKIMLTRRGSSPAPLLSSSQEDTA